MPELNLPTKAGQDEIKTLAGNINSNVDSVKTDLTAVNTNVDSVNSNVNSIKSNVGSNSDASSATGSVHSKIKDLKASVGNTNDSANANGSLHAKIRELRNIAAGDLSTKQLSQYYGSTSDRTGVLFSLSGRGLIASLTIQSYTNYVIEADGVELYRYGGSEAKNFNNIYFNSSFVIRNLYTGGTWGYIGYALK